MNSSFVMSDRKNDNFGSYKKKQLLNGKCEKLLLSIEKHRKNGDWPLLSKHLQKYIKLKEYETLNKYGIGCNQFLEKLHSLFEYNKPLESPHIDKWKNYKTHRIPTKSVPKRPKAHKINELGKRLPKIETDKNLQSLCLSGKDDPENDQTLKRLYEIQILLIATIMLTVKLREKEKRCKKGSAVRTIMPPKDRRQCNKAREMEYPLFYGYDTGQYSPHGLPDQPETYDRQDFSYSERQFPRYMYQETYLDLEERNRYSNALSDDVESNHEQDEFDIYQWTMTDIPYTESQFSRDLHQQDTYLDLKERSRGSFLPDQSITYDRPGRGDKYPWILRQHPSFERSFDREARYSYQRPDDIRYSKPQTYPRYTRYHEKYDRRPEVLNKRHKRYLVQQPYPRYEMANKSTAIGSSLLDVPSTDSEKYNKSGEMMKPVISKSDDIQRPSEIYDKSGRMKKSEMASKSTETEFSPIDAQLSEKYNKSGEMMKPVISKSDDIQQPSFSKVQQPSEIYDKSDGMKKSSEMVSKSTETEPSLFDVQFSEKYDKSDEVQKPLEDKFTMTGSSLESQPYGKYSESSDSYSSRTPYENKRYYKPSESRYPYGRTEIKDPYRRIDAKSRPPELRKRMARRRKTSYPLNDQSSVERIKSFINQMYMMRNLLSIPSSEYQNMPEQELLTRKGESDRKPPASEEPGNTRRKPRKQKRKRNSEDESPPSLIMIRDSRGQSYFLVARKGQVPTEIKKTQVEMSKVYKKSKEKHRVSPQSSEKLEPPHTEIHAEEEKSKSSSELLEPEKSVEEEKSKSSSELLEPEKSVEEEKSKSSSELLEPEKPVEEEKYELPSELLEPEKSVEEEKSKSSSELLEPEKSVEEEKSKSSSELLEPEKPVEEEKYELPSELLEPEKSVEEEKSKSSSELLEPEKSVEEEKSKSSSELLEPEKPVEEEKYELPSEILTPEKPVEEKKYEVPSELLEPEKPVEEEKYEVPSELLEPEKPVEEEKYEVPSELLEPEKPIEQEKLKSSSELLSDKSKMQKSKKSWLGRLISDKSKSKSSSVIIEQDKSKSKELDKKIKESDEDEESSSTTTEEASAGKLRKIQRTRKRKTFKLRR